MLLRKRWGGAVHFLRAQVKSTHIDVIREICGVADVTFCAMDTLHVSLLQESDQSIDVENKRHTRRRRHAQTCETKNYIVHTHRS